ncbi:MAG: NapC/NirT family cytochrome c [Nitrospira sp.]|nr:NapC/NirT family cytochrome c [bacterium]MBL7049829.1 NapC/NirT family cytochrome c [Nitrospira sp.]
MKRGVLVVIAIVVVVLVFLIAGAEYYTSRPSFCGSCHIMKNYHASWQNDKHGEENVACVDCHYPPGEHHALKSKFKGLGQLFTYLGTGPNLVRTPAKVNDASCTTSECHPKEKFLSKKIQYGGKIPYVHNTHMDRRIEGQELHCDTCHQHVSAEKHFEVPKEACYLCHFKNAEFNEGRAKCSLCHTIPEKSLRKIAEGDEESGEGVTHAKLEKSKVACQSCHYQIIQGEGNIKKDDCFNCHEYSEEKVKQAGDKKLMHQEHVSAQNAKCFDCHLQMQHKETDFLERARSDCFTCHPDHHVHQKNLLTGTGGKGMDKEYPIMHHTVKVNCFACHTRDSKDAKGVKVMKGNTDTCISCHSEREGNLPLKWMEDILDILEEADEMEKEALRALEKAKGNVDEKTIARAMVMISEAQENMRIVWAGGGVHNKKYAVLLLDIALEKLDDAVALLD